MSFQPRIGCPLLVLVWIFTAAPILATSAAAGSSPGGRAALKCQNAILLSGSAFLTTVSGALDNCARTRLSCSTPQPPENCDAKATQICTVETQNVLATGRARTERAIVKACGALQLSDVLAPGGLDFLRQEAECQTRFGTGLDSIDGLARCARLHYERAAALLYGTELPRARQLIVSEGGLASTAVPFLPDTGGIPGPVDLASLSCAKDLVVRGSFFTRRMAGSIRKCLYDLFKCAQLRPGEQACTMRVGDRCRKHAQAIAGQRLIFQSQITNRKCAPPVSFAQLQSPAVLNLVSLKNECELAGAPKVQTLADHTLCLSRAHECRLVDTFRATMPRADDLLSGIGLAFADLACPPNNRPPRFGDITKAFTHPGTSASAGQAPPSSFRGDNFFSGVSGGKLPTPGSRGLFGPITKSPRSVTSGSLTRLAAGVPNAQSILVSVQGLNGAKVDGFFEIPTTTCPGGNCVSKIALDYTKNFGSGPLEPVFALKSITNGVTEISPYVPVPQVPEPLFSGIGAGTLLMPFDATAGRNSQLLVHRVGDLDGDVSTIGKPLAAHVVFYDEGGNRAADGVVCLSGNATVVLDPVDLSNLSGSSDGNLSGVRGLAVVTAYEANTGASGTGCTVLNPAKKLNALLNGSWTINDPASFFSYGRDAIAIPDADALPDPGVLDSGIYVPTFNPLDVQSAQVLLLGIESGLGSAPFKEIAPIPARGPNGVSACCSVRYVDNIGQPTTLPDYCFGPVGFAGLADNFSTTNTSDRPLIPSDAPIGTSGQLVLDHCRSFNSASSSTALGRGSFRQFLFALNGETFGPFPTGALIGRYRAPVLAKPDDTNQPPEAAKGVLVMPFDDSAGQNGFQIVRSVGKTSAPIGTHWTYWSEAGEFLAERFVCLSPVDTSVATETAIQSQTVENVNIGPVINLSGERGFAVVTAYASPDLSAGCGLNSASTPIDDVIVGNWIIADLVTNNAVGGDALGFAHAPFPGTSATGRSAFTLDPNDLTGSLVMAIGLQFGAGPRGEVAPIPRNSVALNGASVCCQVELVGDGTADETALPNVCFNAASFRPLTQALARDGEVPLVPPSLPLDRGGYIRFSNCLTANGDGTVAGLSEGDSNQAFFAMHVFIAAGTP